MSTVEPAIYEAPSTTLNSALGYEADISPIDIAEMGLVRRRLSFFSPLDDIDEASLRRHTGSPITHRVGADLGDDGDSTSRFLISGWACRVRDTPWGGRQILDFLLPGDQIGFSLSPHLGGLYRVVALTRGVSVDALSLRDRVRTDPETYPTFRTVCTREERARACRMLDHTTRLGSVSATQAMVHLLLELRRRLSEIDQLTGDRFPMPLSQESIRESLGITVTQVYRILTQLRKDGLIRLGQGWAEIPDPRALASFAGLDPRKT